MLNDSQTLDQQLLLNCSDFPLISWPRYRVWHSTNWWVVWSICNGCGMPARNAYPSRHLVPSSFLETCLCSNCWDQISRFCQTFTRLFTMNTPWYFLDFALNPRYDVSYHAYAYLYHISIAYSLRLSKQVAPVKRQCRMSFIPFIPVSFILVGLVSCHFDLFCFVSICFVSFPCDLFRFAPVRFYFVTETA